MSMRIQCLRDAEEVEDRPLFDFCQWARENDGIGHFGQHYDWADAHSCIMDLGSLHDEIKDYIEDADCRPVYQDEPPDIRPWLKEQIEKGIVLAYVSW